MSVDWTGIGDSMYTFAVHNGHGAPVWYHPKHDDATNAELHQHRQSPFERRPSGPQAAASWDAPTTPWFELHDTELATANDSCADTQ